MEKGLLFSQYKIILFLILSFFIYHSSYSQCPIPVPNDVDISVGKCASNFQKVKDLLATGTSPSSVIEWFSEQTEGIALDPNELLVNGTYWVQQTIDGCISNRVSTMVTIFNPEIPTMVSSEQQFCYTSIPTVADLIPSGNDILWYEEDYIDGSENLGTPLASEDELIDGKTYWAAQYNFPCETVTRISTTVTLEKSPNAGTNGAYSDCEINLVDKYLFDLLGGDPEEEGTWTAPDGSVHSGNFIAGVDTAGDYTYTVVGGPICPQASAIISIIIKVVKPPLINETSQNFCIPDHSDSPTLADLTIDDIEAGNSVVWYADENSTTVLPLNTVLTNNTTYWAAQFDPSINCESAIRDSKTAIIEVAPNSGLQRSYTQCEVDMENLILFSLLGGNPDDTGTWTSPNGSAHSGNFVAGVDTAGDYTYTVAGGTICPQSLTTISIIITVIQPPTINETEQSFCIPNIASTPTLEDLTIDAIEAGNSAIWYADENSTTALPLNTVLTNNTTYWAAQFDPNSNCESASRDSKTALIEITPNAGTNGSFTGCEVDLVDTDLFTLLGGSPDNGGTWTAPNGSAHLGTFIAGVDTAGDYTYTVEGGSICPSSSATVTIIITVIPPPTINDTDQSFCIPDIVSTPTLADLTIDAIEAGNSIIWYADENSTTALSLNTVLTNNTTYWAAQFDPNSNCESASRDSKTALIEITPNAGTNGSFTGCEVDLVDTDLFTLLGGSPDNGGTWTAPNGSAHLGTFIAGVDTAGDYTYTVEGGTICPSSSATVTINIIVIPPPTINETEQSFCIPDITSTPTLADLIIDAIEAGNSVVWYADENSTTALPLNTVLTNNTTYWAAQFNPTSNCESATRDSKTALIKVTPDAGMNGSFNGCEVSLVDTDLFTLLEGSPDNGGTWTAPDGSAHSGTFIAGVDTAGDYIYSVEGDTICPSSSSTVSINITVIPQPTITEIEQSFCIPDIASTPTLADLTIDAIEAGNSVIWYADENSTTALPLNTVLTNNTTYWAAQFDPNSNCESATRDSKTALIQVTPNAGTNGSFTGCEVDLVDTDLFTLLEGSPDNGGTWTAPDGSAHSGTFIAGVDTAGDYIYTVEGDTICPLSSSTVSINITVIPQPTITEINQSFCIPDIANTPTLADLTIDTLESGNSVVWYASENSTTALPINTVLTNNTTYWAAQFDLNSNCESATRDSKTALIEVAPNAGTNGSFSGCAIDFHGTNLFSLLGSNPDTTGSWITPDGSIHSGIFNAETDTAGIYIYTVSSSFTPEICESSSSQVNLIFNEVTAPLITSNNLTFCKTEGRQLKDLTADDDSTALITWYDSQTGGNILDINIELTTKIYWASLTNNLGCESFKRTPVDVTILDFDTPTAEPNQTFCLIDLPTISSLVANGSNILWYESESDDISNYLDSNLALENNKTYWVANADPINGCESPSRVQVLVKINDVDSPTTTTSNQVFCATDNSKVKDLNIHEDSVLWYDSEDATTPINPKTLLEDQKTYYVAQTNNSINCESSIRLAIHVTVNNLNPPNIISLGNEFCKIDNPTVFDLNEKVSASNDGLIKWFDSYPNGNEINLTERLIEGKTYFSVETNSNGCTSTTPLAVTVTLEACEEFEIKLYDGFSPTGNGTNDTFKIGNLRELYPNFKLEFFNRWGNLVYTGNSSNSDWNGRLNGDGELVPTGVYYYIIYFNKDNKKPMQRRLYLSR